jgi:hypothetical protein
MNGNRVLQHDLEVPIVSDAPTIYGCCGLFDMCDDNNLMSLSFEGTNKFLDWVGWERTNVCIIKKNFITYVGPENDSEGDYYCTPGYITDPCGPSHGVEWGTCDFMLKDFALLRRHGPERNATRASLKLCEAQPRYRLDGTPIVSDAEFDMRLATEVLIQDLKRMLISGDARVPGQFDGLEELVDDEYYDTEGRRCTSMDSMMIDWNGNDMGGGAGITWNGNPQPAGYNYVDYLLSILRRIRDRISYAPQLAAQGMNVGDIVIVGTTSALRCLLDAFTCWNVCPGVEFHEVNLNTYEARNFRNALNGGMFGAGKIYLDNFEIPLVAYDWGLQKGPTLSDMYVLTGRVGNIRTIHGQYNDLSATPRDYPEGNFRSTDGGRLLTWLNRTQTCVQREVEMQPRLLMWAPWANARIQDVRCVGLGGIIGPDPCKTSFFPEASFHAPECTSFDPNR